MLLQRRFGEIRKVLWNASLFGGNSELGKQSPWGEEEQNRVTLNEGIAKFSIDPSDLQTLE